ncbi:Hypothetical protein R9X50_00197700 [Acrodontium crateriforme]|uniref:Ryanodine receptor Ryr domain-containing protein n=1 Tax=Acrodontium crateriforme TaxID=150365 RepID=A0AAQ3M1G3_9PEZI|nr:Hypothetical protein R9X50_00197700 [Acrodontium crateriforme]
MTSRSLLVAGAVSYDYLVYPMTADDETDTRSSELHQYGHAAQMVIRTGAADLVAQLLTAAAPKHGFQVLGPSLQAPAANSLKHNASAVVDLAADESAPSSSQHYSVVRLRHIGSPPLWHSPSIQEATAFPGGTVVITGSGEAFRNIEPALDFLQKVRPRYIVHHMTRPLATGPLWDLIRDGPRTRDGVPDPDFLAVIIDADDLRAEGIALSRSLSWEATAEDFVRNLGSNGLLDTLVTCPNLIVRFGTEGVIHHRGRDAVDPKLYYHPRAMECDQRSHHGKDQMVGLTSTFTAGFALGFADSKPPNSEKGLRLGIAAAREMAIREFVQSPLDGCPNYPVSQIMDSLVPDKKYAAVSIPSSNISSGDRWSIFDSVTGDPAEVARQIVAVGPDKALASCPVQRLSDLLVVERGEQESLRAIVGAIQERLDTATSKPTSIGIIGPAGAGKKFIASNLAKHISARTALQKLTYNARLLKSDELISACHNIRDSTASGTQTVVIFENFEAILEPGNALLNDFLVIMRDGKFTDRGHFCSLGAPLMFFLVNHDGNGAVGSPRPTTPTHMTPVATDFGAMKRAIDDSMLLDYLHGVVRVAGPNQTSPQDKLYPVRRAIMLRHLLKQKYPHLEVKGTMKVEEGVLHALLLVPSYKHGLRSLEKIISTSRLAGRNKFDVSALPPEEQIQLHVEGRIFMSYLRSPKLPPALREKLAEGLFETYKKRREVMAKTDEERKALLSDRSMRDWEDLAAELKESTRAQADDIPRKLRAVNCFMLEADRTEPLIRVPAFSEEDLDILSEMEHERFNAERLQRQWRMGPRNSKQRTTPFLVPWRDLTQEWRDVDRVMVECVPRILDKAGWKIYKMQNDD